MASARRWIRCGTYGLLARSTGGSNTALGAGTLNAAANTTLDANTAVSLNNAVALAGALNIGGSRVAAIHINMTIDHSTSATSATSETTETHDRKAGPGA